MLFELLLIATCSLLLFAFYKWATFNYDFFEKRNVKHLKPTFLVGNLGGVFMNRYTAIEFAQMLYQSFPDQQ